jgi:hypothetical protein
MVTTIVDLFLEYSDISGSEGPALAQDELQADYRDWCHAHGRPARYEESGEEYLRASDGPRSEAARSEWARPVVCEADALAAAELQLHGLVRLEDGAYAYRADETGGWVIGVSRSDVIGLGARLLRGDEDAYSFWCAESPSGRQVDGLDHDALDAICDAGGHAERDYGCQCGQYTKAPCDWSGHRDELQLVRAVLPSDRGSAEASGTGTHGAYATRLYVSMDCVAAMEDVLDDTGDSTGESDPWVRYVGPAYVEAP